MKPKICIVLLNWNGAKDSIECIKSLKKISYTNLEILVIDNNSEKNDKIFLTEELKRYNISIIYNDSNVGFSEGNNIGINKAMKEDFEFVLLLNNDTVVELDFLEPLLNIFSKYDDVGIAAPQINYYDDKNKIWSKGGNISRIRGSGFAYSDDIESDKKEDDKSVSFVSGCCMLIKKDLFKKIGLFDEKFYLYVEDTDFCYRTIQAGYKIYVSYDSKIYHKISGSTKVNLNQLPLYYVTRNRLYFAKKNLHYFYFFTLLYLIISMLFKSILWVVIGKSSNLLSIKNAFYDFYKGNMGKTDHNKFKEK